MDWRLLLLTAVLSCGMAVCVLYDMYYCMARAVCLFKSALDSELQEKSYQLYT